MACALRRACIPRALILLAGHLATGCHCPGIGMDRFTSGDAITNASCWASDWSEDAVLHSVYSARDSSTPGSGSGWSIDSDGQGSRWTVVFTAPSAKCGTQLWRTRTFTVDVNTTTASGEACSPVTWPCNVGLPSTPVDGSVVVPAGWAGIAALPGFDPGTAVFMIENLYDRRNVNGEIVNRQDWELWSYWKQSDVTYQAAARFNAAGKMTGVVGPCAYGDDACLRP